MLCFKAILWFRQSELLPLVNILVDRIAKFFERSFVLTPSSCRIGLPT